ncbi:transglutaminase-like cysteine peptidase [uncultured Cohaesibacter sp.]|uniref:transglutaminase-like cysteine peptidase n=1 Tax=uncultured Cohaesibacter sp. TaxID=1002546 RepID=UPI0029C6B695|nr:transglutaminase-like cysteine peptidase [uncultured Cohaesibacter sp.]
MTRHFQLTFFAKRRLLACAIAIGSIVSLVPGIAVAEVPGTMRVNERTNPPAGHVYYCAGHPSACNRHGQGAVTLSQQSWDQLLEVNASVNRSIQAKPDGQIDEWSAYVPEGDCEDYALTKQQELLRKGWPSDALLLTTAFLEDGTYHAVLLVRTDRGEFILDNLKPTILPWQEVHYRWNKRQAVGNPQIWQRVAGAPEPGTQLPAAGLRLRRIQ